MVAVQRSCAILSGCGKDLGSSPRTSPARREQVCSLQQTSGKHQNSTHHYQLEHRPRPWVPSLSAGSRDPALTEAMVHRRHPAACSHPERSVCHRRYLLPKKPGSAIRPDVAVCGRGRGVATLQCWRAAYRPMSICRASLPGSAKVVARVRQIGVPMLRRLERSGSGPLFGP